MSFFASADNQGYYQNISIENIHGIGIFTLVVPSPMKRGGIVHRFVCLCLCPCKLFSRLGSYFKKRRSPHMTHNNFSVKSIYGRMRNDFRFIIFPDFIFHRGPILMFVVFSQTQLIIFWDRNRNKICFI